MCVCACVCACVSLGISHSLALLHAVVTSQPAASTVIDGKVPRYKLLVGQPDGCLHDAVSVVLLIISHSELRSADAPEGKRTACYDIEVEVVSTCPHHDVFFCHSLPQKYPLPLAVGRKTR